MADLGKILVLPRGEYSSANLYEILDLVTFNNGSYICKVATSTGIDPTDTTNWMKIVEDGKPVTAKVKKDTVDEYILEFTDKNHTFDSPNLKGKDGNGSTIYWKTMMTDTSTTAQIYPTSGIAYSLKGDMNVNPTTWGVYECTVQGEATVAEWLYKGNIQGASGSGTGDMTKAEYATNGIIGLVDKAKELVTTQGSIDEIDTNDFKIDNKVLKLKGSVASDWSTLANKPFDTLSSDFNVPSSGTDKDKLLLGDGVKNKLGIQLNPLSVSGTTATFENAIIGASDFYLTEVFCSNSERYIKSQSVSGNTLTVEFDDSVQGNTIILLAYKKGA